jgi:L,D-peptidoglycan transpeptidase YkuD (ErfK/YbiS/YcfS/YnhG family)
MTLMVRICREIPVALLAASITLAAQGQEVSDVLQSRLPWSDARQLVLVTTPDWDATRGEMRRFLRTAEGWEQVARDVPVVVGRAGAAWGVGMHPMQPGPQKQEGDGRSPAGVFALGIAFGYAESADTGLSYVWMNASDWCIDVAESPLYNQIVDARDIGIDEVAGSTEPMRRDLHVDGDQRYKLGFAIQHNPANEPGAGSCIFAHLWNAPDAPTAGCTAMAEPHMQETLGWLELDANPVFILLPQQEYERLKRAWRLPNISDNP